MFSASYKARVYPSLKCYPTLYNPPIRGIYGSFGNKSSDQLKVSQIIRLPILKLEMVIVVQVILDL